MGTQMAKTLRRGKRHCVVLVRWCKMWKRHQLPIHLSRPIKLNPTHGRLSIRRRKEGQPALPVLPEPHQQEVCRGRGEVVRLTPHLIHRRLVRITRRIRQQRSRCQAEWLCGSCASTNWHQTMRCWSCLRRAPPSLPLVPGHSYPQCPGAHGQNVKIFWRSTTMAELEGGTGRGRTGSAVARATRACLHHQGHPPAGGRIVQ